MYNTKSITIFNSAINELMIRKSLIEPFDKERAEMYEEEIYQLKQLINEKTNQTQRGEGIRHSRNYIRQIESGC
jgi:hypothetical protein